MKTITSRVGLKVCTEKYVYVVRDRQVYMLADGEYIPKPYFTTSEASKILGKDRQAVQYLCRKLGIQAKANKKQTLRLTFQQLQQMADA